MAFLDNSGDIILDAVLTDTGRMRLAKGDGSFRITKFGLADDEIDYENYNKDHASGSAYYDLNVMLTPVLEAFTNNGSTMKNKLISFSRTDLLYLPVVKMFTGADEFRAVAASVDGSGVHFVTVDGDTSNSLLSGVTFSNSGIGVIKGDKDNMSTSAQKIRLDQGIDNTARAKTVQIDADLMETSYIVQIDNRFGKIREPQNGNTGTANVSFIDDDNIATYYLSLGTDEAYVQPLSPATSNNETGGSSLAGSRGTKIMFSIAASDELEASSFLFTEVGGANTITIDGNNYYYIDSNIRISGATTGYMVDVPVRFLKKV
jgi:hypothetical protein